MPFWSGELIEIRGPREGVITPFDRANIDCAAYQLRLGRQAFVTQETKLGLIDRFAVWRGNFPGLNRLAPGDVVAIPPGQFAYLLTAERIKLPDNVVGFISVKARMKLQGLVNVSGFHVDPGWDGHLIFGVLNAGASTLVFRRGDPLFLLFLADLDRSSTYLYTGTAQYGQIPSAMMQSMADGVPSLQSMAVQVDNLRGQVKTYTVGASIIGILLGIWLAALALPDREKKSEAPPPAATPPIVHQLPLGSSAAPALAAPTSAPTPIPPPTPTTPPAPAPTAAPTAAPSTTPAEQPPPPAPRP
ncbi:MAG TPA: hypothetical protein VM074_11720 [Solimonas sp.]|nr:hypothetical protein [Solimonas sp.]